MTAYSVRYSASALRVLCEERSSTRVVRFSTKQFNFDDIDIIARNPETVKDVYTRLKAEARRMGLAMNTMKTKYMKGRSSKNDDPTCLRVMS